MRAAFLTLLVCLPAHATWRATQISGTPKDVDTVDAGVAVVASSTASGAMAVYSGNSTTFAQTLSSSGDFVSAALRPPACLIGLLPNATVQFSGACPVTGNNGLTSTVTIAGRLRKQPNGALYAYAWRAAGQVRLQRAEPDAGAASTDWTVLNGPLTDFNLNEAPLSVMTAPGGGELAAFGHTAQSLVVYLDGGSFRSFTTAALIRDVALFENASGGAGAVVVNAGGVVALNPDVADSGFVPVNAPVRTYVTASFKALGGSANGSGFGMLTAGNQIYSPVPNPNAPGRDWVLRPEDAGFLAGTLVRATCQDPSFCVAITNATTGSNVFGYFNDFAPISDQRPALVPSGGTATYVLDAGDPDGDPIWVTWTGGGFSWDGGDPRTITVIGPLPPVGCTIPTTAPLTAMLSDGLAAHDRLITIPVTVTGTAANLPALVSTPPTLDFVAGDPALTVKADYPDDSGCNTPSLSWSIAPDGGLFSLVSTGANSVAVTPPAVFCRPTSQTFTLRGVGAADASVVVPVTVDPWGRPNVPLFQPPIVTQRAGSDAGYAPDASTPHVCHTTSGFPGAPLLWIVDGGAPGVTVVTGPDRLDVYSTNACVSGTVFAQAKRHVTGFPLQTSPAAGTLEVRLVPDWKPITGATPFDAGFSYDNALSQVQGNFSSGATCATDRDLRAEVSVTASDGGTVTSKSGFAVPGGWAVDVPGGCGGGSFVATASLVDDAGVRYGQVASFAFDAGKIDARVPALTVTEVPVTCAEGARGELELALLPTDCSAQQFSWIQDRGPALTLVPDGGAKVAFATATLDLQAQAGAELGWSITASIGAGNGQVASRSIRLIPAPFVQITHRTDTPVAREEEAVGVEVILTNPTACAVSGVVLRESLGGLKPFAGSVRLGGVRLEETIANDVLEVSGLSLPALGSTSVTYLAKVPLLSVARPRGQVLLTGTDVTVTAGPSAATGCGCDASGGGAFALLVLGAALVRSRRRSG